MCILYPLSMHMQAHIHIKMLNWKMNNKFCIRERIESKLSLDFQNTQCNDFLSMFLGLLFKKCLHETFVLFFPYFYKIYSIFQIVLLQKIPGNNYSVILQTQGRGTLFLQC